MSRSTGIHSKQSRPNIGRGRYLVNDFLCVSTGAAWHCREPDEARNYMYSFGILNKAWEKGMSFINSLAALSTLIACMLPSYALADIRGITPTEIRIGQTMPYTGPVSAFGALGKGEVGYFRMVNE